PARARSEGTIDPEITAVRLRRPSGAAGATLVIYAMHPTSAPHDALSADWPAQLELPPPGAAPGLVLPGARGNTPSPRDAPLAARCAAGCAGERRSGEAAARRAAAVGSAARVRGAPGRAAAAAGEHADSHAAAPRGHQRALAGLRAIGDADAAAARAGDAARR